MRKNYKLLLVFDLCNIVDDGPEPEMENTGRIFLEWCLEESKLLFWRVGLPNDPPSGAAEDVTGHMIWVVRDAIWEVIRE